MAVATELIVYDTFGKVVIASLRAPLRLLWQSMQSAPAPAFFTRKPDGSMCVSSSRRSPVVCGSWQAWQVCGSTLSAVRPSVVWRYVFRPDVVWLVVARLGS